MLTMENRSFDHMLGALGHNRFLCELRDHGAYGVEAQLVTLYPGCPLRFLWLSAAEPETRAGDLQIRADALRW